MAASPGHSAPMNTFPPQQGMYNPAFEKDACGLAMVATLSGEPSHEIIDLALTALRNLEHRGAIGSDAGTGDGAGILTQMPDAFLRAVTAFDLPPVGEYGHRLVLDVYPLEPPDALLALVEKNETMLGDLGVQILGGYGYSTE